MESWRQLKRFMVWAGVLGTTMFGMTISLVDLEQNKLEDARIALQEMKDKKEQEEVKIVYVPIGDRGAPGPTGRDGSDGVGR